MIEIVVNAETYIYNAYHMAKAFYPTLEVTSRVEEKAFNFVEFRFADGVILDISPEEVIQEEAETLKKAIDRLLYRKLREYSQKELAWGMLMGVRPTKLAYDALEKGKTKEEFLEEFQRTTFATEEKARLAWDIVGREKALLDQLDYENGYSLYIGIPFCPTVCSYCSFSSGEIGAWAHRIEDYLDALIKELTFVSEISKEKKLNTIYIGGGTPTTLSAFQLDRLLTEVDHLFSREHLLEFTVEAGRPDSITEDKLRVIKNHKVTRISINPQTMQQKTLDKIERKHTVSDIVDTFHMARRMGFDNINMDLIAGLEDETPEDMADTLRQIGMLNPDSLTVHSLAIKRAAKLAQSQKNPEKFREKKSYHDSISEMITLSTQFAESMELFPYYLYRQKNIAGNFENVGYAKVDKAGIYNILIMEEKQTIIAVGAGSSTKMVLKEPVVVPGNKKNKMTKLLRQENVKAIDAYIERIDEMIGRKGEMLWR